MKRLLVALTLLNPLESFACPAGQKNICDIPRPFGGCAHHSCISLPGWVPSILIDPQVIINKVIAGIIRGTAAIVEPRAQSGGWNWKNCLTQGTLISTAAAGTAATQCGSAAAPFGPGAGAAAAACVAGVGAKYEAITFGVCTTLCERGKLRSDSEKNCP